MKKFIIIVFTVLAAYFLFDLAYYRWSFYLPKNDYVKVVSYVENKNMRILEKDGYKNITVKGVNIGGSIPGHYVTDYAIPYETYYSWLESIQNMGANTVRLNTIFNDEFYNALYDFNKNHDTKLYLIQGINLDSYALNSHHDGFSSAFYGELITQAENAVDVIHGRKKLALSKHGKGTYKHDISEYVLGYIVGSEWMEDTVLYTDKSNTDKRFFSGNYVETSEDATPFEVMLTKVIDHMISYETKKYNEQHNISFINSPESDPVAIIPEVRFDEEKEVYSLHPESLKYFYHKAIKLDMEHIKTKNDFKGLFAAYNVSSYYPNYLSYENKEYDDTYASYLQNLNAYHTYPVLITEFAYSTSRSVSTVVDDQYGDFGGMTEEEQGASLVKAYHTILSSGSVGGIIATWQDEWDKRSYNTMEKVDITHAINWSDAQTTNQGLGLLTFDPGKDRSIVYVDGDTKEWTDGDRILYNDDVSLSVKQDEKYLYLYIDNKKKATGPLYIPIDTTPKSGTKVAEDYNLNFDRYADFLLVINGREGELLVQEYYDVLRAVDGYEVYNKNSYIDIPDRYSPVFTPINLLIEPYSVNTFSRNYGTATLKNTGRLRFGNANPSSLDFDSQADFYEKDGKIEIRLPWQILNFSDPSSSLIHDDYYENYGVDSIKIDEMYIGASFSKDISLGSYLLKEWGNKVTYHERLKKSYDIVKNDWRNMP